MYFPAKEPPKPEVPEIRIPFDYQWLNDGHILVSFVPRSAGPHVITVRWRGQEVKGSPFTAKVAESAMLLKQNSRYGFGE